MIIGIDPGANGGIAWGSSNQKACAVKMPATNGDILALLRGYYQPGSVVYLEDLVKYAGTDMKGATMSVYARNFGFIEGAVMALGLRLVIVPPKKWQGIYGFGSSRNLTKTVWKNKLKAEAQRRNPHLKVTLATADALLILEWGGTNG
jgi:hypothetical protein